ncbi:FAD-binding protein [Cupriavidus sp. AcVe19-1a]|uniref:FAD-binding protein n=1 Tax=Cupriavidus sp. AcVe19-1a TaxID=2821359 RepID=UPI001FD748E5|nr:FAD-binding protein [Cupriavidus sp. AcVe19-1a]
MNAKLEVHQVDVLVLGAGVAGYQAAIAARRSGASVAIAGMAKGASPYILGFNVAMPDGDDSADDFAEDTYLGGYGLGEPSLIHAMAQESWDAFEELYGYGVPFAMNGQVPSFRHLSGSRRPRSVFVASGTGNAIHRALTGVAGDIGIEEILGWHVVRLIRVGNAVQGAVMRHRHEKRCMAVLANATVLALGGLGRLYDASTYPHDVSGSSYALALEAGATLRDMEFVQFEPTVIVDGPSVIRGMEMPTAMLGAGATLLNAQGERFMLRYNPASAETKIEKAKLALFIQKEIDEGRGLAGGTVAFDARPLGREALQQYETHYRRLRSAGIDPATEVVRIAPAAHSLMGGVEVDACLWSGVDGLFACGEAAGGVHGASRIAGNGAADAIVLSRRCGRFAYDMQIAADASTRAEAVELAEQELAASDPSPKHAAALSRIASQLAESCGIHRSAAELQHATNVLAAIEDHESMEVRRSCMVARSIVTAAALRDESRGAHFRRDFPHTNDTHWRKSIRSRLQESRLLTSTNPAWDNGS